MNSIKGLFLDRDGVINQNIHFAIAQKDIKFIEGIFELVQHAKLKDYIPIVVTNQSGIGRGYFTEEDFHKLMRWMLNIFKKENAEIAGYYFSPFHPIHGIGKYKCNHSFRKPNPGMIFKAQKDFHINLHESLLIGDSISDIDAGISAGIAKNFLLSDLTTNQPIYNGNYYEVDSLKKIISFL